MFRPGFRRRALTLTLLGAAGLCTGCNRPEGGPTQLQPRTNRYVADIPVPVGFAIDESRSSNKALASPPVRWIDHTYEGRGDPLAVRNFYVIGMPAEKWQALS